MSAVRIISKNEDEDFPYEAAKAYLTENFTLDTYPVDFEEMIEVGRRIGWPDALIRANQLLAERGKCFNFAQTDYPKLQGSLFEDNIFFSFTDSLHYEICLPVIKVIAKSIGCVVFKQ